MQYTIVAYRSRSVTTKVYNYLIGVMGISCSLISTPRSAGIGCGLSIRLDRSVIAKVPELSTADTFAGFFSVVNVNGKTIVSRI